MGLKELSAWMEEHPYKTYWATVGIVFGGGYLARAAYAQIEKVFVRKKLEKSFKEMPEGSVPLLKLVVDNHGSAMHRLQVDIEELSEKLKITNVYGDGYDNDIFRIHLYRECMFAFNNTEDCINAYLYLMKYFKKIIRNSEETVNISCGW